MGDELEAKVAVVILTDSYRVRGNISLIPGARLTDYLAESKEFIALTEVEVRDNAGQYVLSSPFLNLNRAHIQMIMPAEIASQTAWKDLWPRRRGWGG
jgi:hypothetical protein